MLPVVNWGCLTLALLAIPAEASGQAFSSYAHFDSLTAAQAGAVRVKLTHVGVHDAGWNSLVLGASSGGIGVQPFAAYYRPQFVYEKDMMRPIDAHVTAAEIEALIDSIATLPAITAGDVDSRAAVSFSLVDTLGAGHGFEAIVSEASGEALVGKVLAALAGNAVAARAVRECACSFAILPGTPAARVSPTVSVSGFRRVLGTNDFVATVRVSNTTGSTLAAPVVLVPGIAGMGVRMRSEDGWTCKVYPLGEPYVVLPVGPPGLANGATVTIKLTISNPDHNQLEVGPSVFAGPGVY